MECWQCNRPANGVCIFCGRGICKQHSKSLPHVISLYEDSSKITKALVTGNALWCGICEPKEELIVVEQLSK